MTERDQYPELMLERFSLILEGRRVGPLILPPFQLLVSL